MSERIGCITVVSIPHLLQQTIYREARKAELFQSGAIFKHIDLQEARKIKAMEQFSRGFYFASSVYL